MHDFHVNATWPVAKRVPHTLKYASSFFAADSIEWEFYLLPKSDGCAFFNKFNTQVAYVGRTGGPTLVFGRLNWQLIKMMTGLMADGR